MKVEASKCEASIEVSAEGLMARGGFGQEVANITVTREDGKIQRFYVRLVSANNRVKCQVTASRLNLPQDSKCSVTGAWFQPNLPAGSSLPQYSIGDDK